MLSLSLSLLLLLVVAVVNSSSNDNDISNERYTLINASSISNLNNRRNSKVLVLPPLSPLSLSNKTIASNYELSLLSAITGLSLRFSIIHIATRSISEVHGTKVRLKYNNTIITSIPKERLLPQRVERYAISYAKKNGYMTTNVAFKHVPNLYDVEIITNPASILNEINQYEYIYMLGEDTMDGQYGCALSVIKWLWLLYASKTRPTTLMSSTFSAGKFMTCHSNTQQLHYKRIQQELKLQLIKGNLFLHMKDKFSLESMKNFAIGDDPLLKHTIKKMRESADLGFLIPSILATTTSVNDYLYPSTFDKSNDETTYVLKETQIYYNTSQQLMTNILVALNDMKLNKKNIIGINVNLGLFREEILTDIISTLCSIEYDNHNIAVLYIIYGHGKHRHEDHTSLELFQTIYSQKCPSLFSINNHNVLNIEHGVFPAQYLMRYMSELSLVITTDIFVAITSFNVIVPVAYIGEGNHLETMKSINERFNLPTNMTLFRPSNFTTLAHSNTSHDLDIFVKYQYNHRNEIKQIIGNNLLENIKNAKLNMYNSFAI